VDDFKKYNDLNGHLNGDQILVEFVKQLKEVLRGQDIIARVGGDEFVVIIMNMQSENAIENKAKSMSEKIEISCSMGVVCFTKKPDDIQKVFSKADALMYDVKRSGKHGYKVIKKN
jgi:diguanylate cyclase (GGDEF)-like protein